MSAFKWLGLILSLVILHEASSALTCNEVLNEIVNVSSVINNLRQYGINQISGIQVIPQISGDKMLADAQKYKEDAMEFTRNQMEIFEDQAKSQDINIYNISCKDIKWHVYEISRNFDTNITSYVNNALAGHEKKIKEVTQLIQDYSLIPYQLGNEFDGCDCEPDCLDIISQSCKYYSEDFPKYVDKNITEFRMSNTNVTIDINRYLSGMMSNFVGQIFDVTYNYTSCLGAFINNQTSLIL